MITINLSTTLLDVALSKRNVRYGSNALKLTIPDDLFAEIQRSIGEDDWVRINEFESTDGNIYTLVIPTSLQSFALAENEDSKVIKTNNLYTLLYLTTQANIITSNPDDVVNLKDLCNKIFEGLNIVNIIDNV